MTNRMQNTDDSGIVPRFSLDDPAAGVDMMANVFGFEVDAIGLNNEITMVLGDQSIVIGRNIRTVGTLRVHHLALAVPDVDEATSRVVGNGGRIAKSMTPNGPLEIPEFWSNGVRVVFFEGPEGILIELCMKLGFHPEYAWGHDHIGILCQSIGQTKANFLSSGCELLAEHDLERSDGVTQACFLQSGRSTIELFSPPLSSRTTANGTNSGWLGCFL